MLPGPNAPGLPPRERLFFSPIHPWKNVDFSSVNIEKYTGFKSSFYDGSVDGSTYSLTMKVTASDKIVQMEIEIVKNDNGYGIYNLDIDFE